jgi:hypothetical protein
MGVMSIEYVDDMAGMKAGGDAVARRRSGADSQTLGKPGFTTNGHETARMKHGRRQECRPRLTAETPRRRGKEFNHG